MNETSRAKTVVIHVDDVGMCHGANRAFLELSSAGFVTSGSVMVPCPWFLEVAEAAADDTTLDLGVHLTLTAEKTHYKWRPLTDVGAGSALVDDNGFFWPDVSSARGGDPAAAEAELRAQIDRALAAGIDVTHLDAHMGATFAPEFIGAYQRMGDDYELPILLTGLLESYSARNHLQGVREETYQEAISQARDRGRVLFDLVLETDWNRQGPPRPTYEPIFEQIGEGLTFMALHPNAPGELDAIEPDSAHIRVGEYELFSDEGFRAWVDSLGLETVGMRQFRDELRSDQAPRPGA